MSIVAAHAQGKVVVDKIFGASAKAQQAIGQFGKDKVINGTQGVLLDDRENLVCLPTVEKVLRNLPMNDLIGYAPIKGLPDFLHDVIELTFAEHKPNAYIEGIATAGGAGALHHAIWNYSSIGDTVLTTDWFWSPYGVLCTEALRKLDIFTLFDEQARFNLEDFAHKTAQLLQRQDNLLVILNTPAHNPTGYSLSDREWDGVLETCKGYARNKNKKITLVVDAAYIDYIRNQEGRKFFEKFTGLPENILVIVAVSMSKSFTMYGQRTGAMIGISSDRETIEEFVQVNEYTSRATWSNVNRGAMKTLSTIYRDKDLLQAVENERKQFVEIIGRRAEIFIEEAKQIKLKTLPYVAGFFLTIPVDNAEVICNKLTAENIFLVSMDKGLRIAVCTIPTSKIFGLAAAIKKVIAVS